MALFGGHFIYRYGAVNNDFEKKFLSGYKQISLYICPVICGILWGLICFLFIRESPVKSDYLREHMLSSFGLNMEDCAYIALQFWPIDEHGNVYPDDRSFFAVAFMNVILGLSFFSVIYFGVKCYRLISDKLGTVVNQSEQTKSLQVQLFYALIVQSAIPCILMYIPAAIIFIFPMLNLDLGLNHPFVAITIAVYPAIDPFPTMLIIKSYRRECMRLMRCRKSVNQINDYSTQRQQSAGPNMGQLIATAAL